MKLVELQEASRMYKRARKVRRDGFTRYDGSPEEICRQIIDDCWDPKRKYLRVSTGHFCEFYMRDFAHCIQALISLGYRKQVNATLRYALETFQHHGRVEQTISPKGVPFSFPSYSPDALALLLFALDAAKQEKMAEQYRELLQKEIKRFADQVVDPKTQLPRKGKRFSGMRDHARREGACYDSVMILLVAKYAPQFKLKFPYKHANVAKKFLRAYWNGDYFFSDLHKQPIVVGDANVFPFWTDALEGAVPAEEIADMRTKTLYALHEARLDQPWPLRYVNSKDAVREITRLHIGNLFAYDYQTHSIWMNIGLCMLDVLAQENPEAARQYTTRIGELITEHGTFLELYDRKGKPFRTPWYATDEGMLWCAQWLALYKSI